MLVATGVGFLAAMYGIVRSGARAECHFEMLADQELVRRGSFGTRPAVTKAPFSLVDVAEMRRNMESKQAA
jgi:hypothetical protein